MKNEPRESHTICLPFEKNQYDGLIKDPKASRAFLDGQYALHPELFPAGMAEGYAMKDIRQSKKLGILIRRITVGGIDYSLRPSFAMPSMSGFTADTEKALYLRKYGVPFHALAHVFGRDAMYWYRLENHLGRHSVAGTTVCGGTALPVDLLADEKHTRLAGEKCYVATTVAKGCILGVAVAENAGTEALAKAYGVFAGEARAAEPAYRPKTVNTDGWAATQNAWASLFPGILVLCCFLHVFIKIRDRAKLKHQAVFLEAATKLWDCYRAASKAAFSQRVRRLVEWCAAKPDLPAAISGPIGKLGENRRGYSSAYDHPGCHRTSNMLDRLMQRMDRHLFGTQYFHGGRATAELNIRGWALIYNFAPSNPMTVRKHLGKKSPAERLNGFSYHDNWLENLLVSASLQGVRASP